METRCPVEGSFGTEFPANCNHCRVMAAWSSKVRRCCVQISWNLSNGKSVKSCVIYWTKKNKKTSPGSPAVATARIAPKISQGQCSTMYSECSRFHPNRFTFSGVIAEHVNTAKARHKVNTIFGGSLPSSHIINQTNTRKSLPPPYVSTGSFYILSSEFTAP